MIVKNTNQKNVTNIFLGKKDIFSMVPLLIDQYERIESPWNKTVENILLTRFKFKFCMILEERLWRLLEKLSKYRP